MISLVNSQLRLKKRRRRRKARAGSAAELPYVGLRTVAVQNRIFSTSDSQTSLKEMYFRTWYDLGTDTANIVFSINNWIFTNTGFHDGQEAYTILELSLQHPNGTTIPVTFGGSRSRLMAINDLDVQTDPIVPANFGVGSFTKGSRYWLKGKIAVAANTEHVPCQSQWLTGNVAGSQFAWYDSAATTVSSTDVAGSFTSTGTAVISRSGIFCPIMLGEPIVDGPSFGAIGDSIMAGFGDSGTFVTGFFQRSLYGDGTNGDLIPGLNFAVGGTSGGDYLGVSQVQHYYQYAKYWGENFAANDLGSADSISLAAMKTRKLALWQEFRDSGAQGVYSVSPFFRLQTSNSWVDAAGQSYNTSLTWGPGGTADLLEAWMATQVGVTIDKHIPTTAVRDATETRKVKTDGNANKWTTDGLHLARQANEDMKAVMAPILRDFESIAIPVNTVEPTIAGTGQPGFTLTINSDGTWTGLPFAYYRKWQRNGVDIPGETGSTYAVQVGDVGTTITGLVAAENAGGISLYEVSSNTKVISAAPATPSCTAAPVVTGTVEIGSVLTVSNGTWTNSPTSYAYQWQRDGVDISGATSTTYTLLLGDLGKTITPIVTASNGAGATDTPTAASNPIFVSLLAIPNSFALWDSLLGVTVPSGVGITPWTDQSPNAFAAQFATSGNRPSYGSRTLNGDLVADFDGSNDTLSIDNGFAALTTGNNTVFVSYQSDSTTASQKIVAARQSSATRWFIGLNVGAVDRFSVGHQSGGAVATMSVTSDTNPHVGGYSRNGALVTPFYDGVAGSTAAAGNMTMDAIKFSSNAHNSLDYFNGCIRQFFAVARDCTTAEKNAIGAYMAAEVGATWAGL